MVTSVKSRSLPQPPGGVVLLRSHCIAPPSPTTKRKNDERRGEMITKRGNDERRGEMMNEEEK